MIDFHVLVVELKISVCLRGFGFSLKFNNCCVLFEIKTVDKKNSLYIMNTQYPNLKFGTENQSS